MEIPEYGKTVFILKRKPELLHILNDNPWYDEFLFLDAYMRRFAMMGHSSIRIQYDQM